MDWSERAGERNGNGRELNVKPLPSKNSGHGLAKHHKTCGRTYRGIGIKNRTEGRRAMT